MLIKVYGTKNATHKAVITETARFAGRKLMSNRLCESLEISIKMKDIFKTSNLLAEVEWLDTNYRSKMFEITIDSDQNLFPQVLCVLHEMVHVKQFATGEWVQSLRHESLHKWQGNQWIDETAVKYYDLPWEIEAHGREKGMMLEWMAQTDLIGQARKDAWKKKFLF